MMNNEELKRIDPLESAFNREKIGYIVKIEEERINEND